MQLVETSKSTNLRILELTTPKFHGSQKKQFCLKIWRP